MILPFLHPSLPLRAIPNLLAEMNAISDPEKNAERIKHMTIPTITLICQKYE